MISGLYGQGCDPNECNECDVIEYNPRRAFRSCKQPALKVFVRTGKGDVWYPEYLKYRNMHQTRSPSLFEPEPEEGGASTALALNTGASSVEEPVVVRGAFE